MERVVKVKIGFVKTTGRRSGLDFSVTSTPDDFLINLILSTGIADRAIVSWHKSYYIEREEVMEL